MKKFIILTIAVVCMGCSTGAKPKPEPSLCDELTEVDLRIPKRFNVINKDNYEERYKLGASSIHKKNSLINDDYITYNVKTAKLDDLLINNNIGFIKIDVEGHEKNVVMGAINLIKKNKPNLLVEIE